MPDDNATIQELQRRLDALEAEPEPEPAGWMSDVQRALAILLVGTFAGMIAVFTVKLTWSSNDLQQIGPLLKELKDALINMVMMALGFFFGNTLAKIAQDRGQQRVLDKLTPTPPPTNGAAPAAVVAAAAVEAAKAVAPAAAAEAAPAAAAAAAPPAAAEAAPPAVEAELDERGYPKQKE